MAAKITKRLDSLGRTWSREILKVYVANVVENLFATVRYCYIIYPVW